jgi:hypothetical protein
MTTFESANPKRIPYLYHWQRFDPERLLTTLRNRKIWCSKPSTFNDPWDCKPSYNTEILRDEVEHERHLQWYGRITRDQNPKIIILPKNETRI